MSRRYPHPPPPSTPEPHPADHPSAPLPEQPLEEGAVVWILGAFWGPGQINTRARLDRRLEDERWVARTIPHGHLYHVPARWLARTIPASPEDPAFAVAGVEAEGVGPVTSTDLEPDPYERLAQSKQEWVKRATSAETTLAQLGRELDAWKTSTLASLTASRGRRVGRALSEYHTGRLEAQEDAYSATLARIAVLRRLVKGVAR